MGIGENIKKFRTNKGLTQYQLGQLIGKKEITIRRYEKGDILPPIDVISEIAKVLGATTSDLIDTEIDISMGEKIRQARKAKGISQDKLTKSIGISLRALINYESDKRVPPLEIKLKLVGFLGLKNSELDILPISLSQIPTKDLIEELNKRNDWRMTT